MIAAHATIKRKHGFSRHKKGHSVINKRTSPVFDVSEIPIFGEKIVLSTGNVSEPWHVSCDISDLG